MKRTVTDNTDQIRKEAAEIVKNNFYVDDVLKYIGSPKTAMILVKKKVDMYKSDGFYLRKFIYSNRQLLMSILEDQRKNSVRNAYLIGDIPTEKALGIQ